MIRLARSLQPKTQRVCLVLGLALLSSLSVRAQPVLQPNDVVCLIGNALADRMQHDGWVETHIQSRMAEKNITIRNP